MKKVNNSKQLPQIYYGLHMVEGVAEYAQPEGEPQRILILENAIKQMDPSFQGKPVYVHHVEDVKLDTLQNDADGYVVESFFNKLDGKHWVKFIVVSDKGHEALRSGWKLSNAYAIKNTKGGGLWHAVQYGQEVTEGEYLHLAIVPNPRYEESIVLTPDQFKAYNSQKEQELKTLSNSKGDRSMFNFFKKTKLENAEEIANAVVTLSDGSEKTIQQLINEAQDKIKAEAEDKGEKKNEEKKEEKKPEDEKKNEEKPSEEKKEEEKKEKVMANGDHMVKVGESEMSVNELCEKYNGLISAKAAEAAESPKEEEKKNEESEPEKELKAEAKNSFFETLKNAMDKTEGQDIVVEISSDQLARGKARYSK